MKILSFILLITASVFVAGCESETDPLVSWKSVAPISYKTGEMSATIDTLSGYKAITDDVQAFVNKMPISVTYYDSGPPDKKRYCYWIEEITLFEDGTGRHAVKIKIGAMYQNYVLIYNKDNVRIKTTRFRSPHNPC
jgi:hypothetical protein